MIKTFKFRVWDKNNNEYINTKNLFINSDGILCELHDLTLYEKYISEDIETSSIIIEKCTGFKDSSGKYIYEGDIVYIKNTRTLGYVYTPITNVHVINNGYNRSIPIHSFYVDKNNLMMTLWESDYPLKVIGNIHENKNILKYIKE